MKRILIDANAAVVRKGKYYFSGIGRTTLDLLRALSKKDNLPFDLQLFIQNVRGDSSEIDLLPFKQIWIPLPAYRELKLLIKKLHIKEFVSKYDLFHIPHNYE